MAPRPQWKSKSVNALKHCDHDQFVQELGSTKRLYPDVGEFWAQLYKFVLQHGGEDFQQEISHKCAAAEPRHAEKWTSVCSFTSQKTSNYLNSSEI